MNYYKETFLDFENNSKITPLVYILFSADSNKNIKDENIQRKITKKGFTYSFDFYIIQW